MDKIIKVESENLQIANLLQKGSRHHQRRARARGHPDQHRIGKQWAFPTSQLGPEGLLFLYEGLLGCGPSRQAPRHEGEAAGSRWAASRVLIRLPARAVCVELHQHPCLRARRARTWPVCARLVAPTQWRPLGRLAMWFRQRVVSRP